MPKGMGYGKKATKKKKGKSSSGPALLRGVMANYKATKKKKSHSKKSKNMKY